MKKMIALLLAGVLASGVLAGCSQQTQTEASKTADGAVKIILWRLQDTSHVEKWYDEKIAALNEANKGLVYLEEQVIIRADSFAYDYKLSAAIMEKRQHNLANVGTFPRWRIFRNSTGELPIFHVQMTVSQHPLRAIGPTQSQQDARHRTPLVRY